LFEGSPDPIFITTLDGQIIDCNRQAVFVSGFDRRFLLRNSITRLDPLSSDVLTRAGTGRKRSSAVDYESSLSITDQQRLPVEVSAARVPYRDLDCLQWIYRDTSARHELDALRDNLSAMIYHDLRSPLANIISGLELLEETIPPEAGPDAQQLLQIAGRSSAHMQRLVSSLLDINRLESGQELTRLRCSKLKKLLDESTEVISPMVHSKKLEVVKEVPRKVPVVNADEDMIRRVIINLLENAARYSPPGSKITIGIQAQANQVVIFIEDEGTGIPEEAKERIFEKFARIDDESAVRGIGLGLAFCRLAVQAHGGKIWVENLHAGGARFAFSLPLGQRQELTPEG
jgi:K+-sensing histidine kinase KdpD